jgi:hypothetical protein
MHDVPLRPGAAGGLSRVYVYLVVRMHVSVCLCSYVTVRWGAGRRVASVGVCQVCGRGLRSGGFGLRCYSWSWLGSLMLGVLSGCGAGGGSLRPVMSSSSGIGDGVGVVLFSSLHADDGGGVMLCLR